MKFGYKEYQFSNNSIINNIILYMLIISTIFCSRDTLFSTVKYGFFKTFICYVTIIICASIYLIFKNRMDLLIRKKAFFSIGIFVLILTFVSVLKIDFQLYIVSIFFYIFTAFLFIHIFKFDDFYTKYSNVITFLALYSIVTCYIIRPLMFYVANNTDLISTISNSVGLKFYDLGLSFMVSKTYYFRNFGIFREPGIYQFFLLIALFYELLYRNKKYRYVNSIVIIIGILTTFSPPGILVMVLIVLLHFYKLYTNNQLTKKHILFTVLVGFVIISVFCVLFFTNSSFYDLITQSVKKIFTVNDSSSTRINSIVRNIQLFLASPIIGNDFAVTQNGAFFNTNTTFSIFAVFGVFAGLMHFKLIYNMSTINGKKLISSSLIFLGIFILINTQFLLGNTMFWIFSFSSYMVRDKRLNE